MQVENVVQLGSAVVEFEVGSHQFFEELFADDSLLFLVRLLVRVVEGFGHHSFIIWYELIEFEFIKEFKLYYDKAFQKMEASRIIVMEL